MVADEIQGFHPKSLFWKDAAGKCFALVGSSNLTHAAFNKNYEANIFSTISSGEYALAKQWVKRIETRSIGVCEWLPSYQESKSPPPKDRANALPTAIALALPRPRDMATLLADRRRQLLRYREKRPALLKLFRACADGRISSAEFFEHLPSVWGVAIGNRLQGEGFERRGKASNFRRLASSFLRIVDAGDADRDDVVVNEIDTLAKSKVATRKAFLSEMLCLAFPKSYPVLNRPVKEYLKAIKLRGPRGASEGAKYIDMAKKMRSSLRLDLKYPAKNLAELDTLIWGVYGI